MPIYLQKPIPTSLSGHTTADCKTVPFDRLDPRAAEPLVSLAEIGIAGDNYYARSDGSNPPYGRRLNGAIDQLLARASVARMLLDANGLLLESDLEVYVLDAYRPVECQLSLWDFFWDKAISEMPNATDDERERWVRAYVSDPRGFDPSNSETWPLHSTGGAVDLTLRCRSTQLLLAMGAKMDEMIELSSTDCLERHLAAGQIAASDERLLNRRTLFSVMTAVGFTNYPKEYWHFDFGNQMYALMRSTAQRTRAEPAFYGYVAASPEQKC